MADVPRDPNAGAAGTDVRISEALQRLGHEVDEIWAPQLGRRIAHGNLHYLLELPRAYRREMLRAAKTKHYDVIQADQPHGFLAARAKPDGTVFVHHSQGFEPNLERTLEPWRGAYGVRTRAVSRVMAALLARHARSIARDADGHIVSSSSDAECLHSMGVPRERVAVIAQAAPESFLQRDVKPLTRERLRRVLYVGQYGFAKAPMIVADAMRALAKHDDLGFTWVCSRTHHGEVRRIAPPNTEVLDWMPVEQLIDVYDAHGVFLFPSFYEGFGKVFLEAMSRGLCVIASDVAGAHDVITHGRDGLLVPAGDVDAIVQGAQSLLGDDARAQSIAANAAARAREYTWERVAAETVAFYERLSSLR